MKHLLIGIGIFVLGFILLSICSAIGGNGSNSDTSVLIIYSVLFLSSVVGVSTSLILEAIENSNK